MSDGAEKVAYDLLLAIAEAENKKQPSGWTSTERKWILDTYAECLEAVRGRRVMDDKRTNTIMPIGTTPTGNPLEQFAFGAATVSPEQDPRPADPISPNTP